MTLAATKVYANSVPMERNWTRASRSKMSARKAMRLPKTKMAMTGTLVTGLTREKTEKKRPSSAMAYTIRGREKRLLSSTVFMAGEK